MTNLLKSIQNINHMHEFKFLSKNQLFTEMFFCYQNGIL